MKYTSFTEGNSITNKVEINLDMLGPLVLNRIGGHIHGTDIIAIDHGGTSGRMVKFLK
jgi:hypothetical protein